MTECNNAYLTNNLFWFPLLPRTSQNYVTQAQWQICSSYDCIYFHTYSWAHRPSCVLCFTHTDTWQNHAATHANNITDAEAWYSQRVKRAGSVHLHSYGLHICLFFLEGAPPALGEQWKSCWWCSAESVSQGGGSGAQPGISNRHTESKTDDRPRPVERQCRGEGKRPLETHCPSTCYFKTTQILFHSGKCVATVQWTAC